MISLIGRSGSLLLFSNDEQGVVVDADFNLIVETGDAKTLFASRKWKRSKEEVSPLTASLVNIALASADEAALAASAPARMYTIPKAAQAEAKKALEWHKEEKRGGTPVGMNTARTLAEGGQIGIEKVRHIAKYFPRHEVDKKGKGWAPGEDGFPSNGRIAWALWGGDAAWRWAADIVESDNNRKKALKADAYIDEKVIDPFQLAHLMDENYGPEFMARVRLDGSGLDRLYKVDIDGQVYVWDDCDWDSMGHVDGDVWTYDKALDDPYDTCEKSHILIDPTSAVLMAGRLTAQPHNCVSVFDLDADEAQLHARSIPDVDWDMVDYGITAAGEAPLASTVKDGYTPEERSKNASKQVRDGGGKFASQGKRAQVGKEQGVITAVDSKTQSVTVKLDSGSTVNVPAKGMKTIDEQRQAAPSNMPPQEITQGPLDTSGILGEPRTPIDRPNARIPGTLPAMTKEDLHQVLYDFPAWVQSQRDAGLANGIQASAEEPKEDSKDEKPKAKKEEKDEKPKVEVYNHPLLEKWRLAKERSSVESAADTSWAAPVIASALVAATDKLPVEAEKKEASKPAVSPEKEAAPVAETKPAPKPKAPEKPVQLTPETSDVQPMYFAVVAPEDATAVLDLISLVPASSTSTAPMVYRRVDGKWNRDEKTLADLKSATPPPVIPLDSEQLNDVLKQIDGITASAAYMERQLTVLWGPRQDIITAAGGLDRNRGNAEKLRRYWTHGEGAAKIRWGTPGDWKRCVRHLSKYMGVRSKGYCQLRHKEALGYYTATHAKMDRQKKSLANDEFIMEEVLTKNYGVPTVVTDDDLLIPISQIMVEDDDVYDHHWEPDEMTRLYMKDLSRCDDDTFESLTAAGGLDRNRGNAEELRRYWTVGKGAAKIRWNTKGDWTRCVRQLEKYMGPRAKGYCALRHKEATGLWTGDKEHRILYGRNKAKAAFSTDVLKSSEAVIESAALVARANVAKSRFALVASADSYAPGAAFSIPLVIPEGVETGDGRMFRKGSITLRELPLPLLWQIKTSDGHMGSVVVGRIDRMERTDEGIGNAYGVFDSGEYGKEAERLVRHGFIRGVSADMDQFEAEEAKEAEKSATENDIDTDLDKDVKVGGDKLNINKARVMAVTMVPKPAFQECKIFLVQEEEPQEETMIPADGIYVEDVDAPVDEAITACAVVAGAIPVVPPATWFNNPKLKKPTPITVSDDGQVFGHIAAWNVDHIGLVAGTKPPRSKSNYGYFHTGVVRAADGKDYPVGQLTLAGGHADLRASALDAVKHYDDTGSAIADVHAGEDAHGIWVAGALRPSASPEQIRALRASAPSGDWRPIRGSLELVAVCQVNVPGFPIARAMVAAGSVVALVAAGARVLAEMKALDPELEAQVASAKSKIDEFRTERNAELSAKAAELKARVASAKYTDEFAISQAERDTAVKKRQALPDGSYPIRNEEDLKNAIQSFGRAKEEDRAKVRRHIMRRARQLDKVSLLPEKWTSQHVASTSAPVTAAVEGNELRARVAAAMDALGKPQATEPVVPAVPENAAPVVRTKEKLGNAVERPVAEEEEAPVQEVEQGKIESIARDPYVQESLKSGKYVPGKTQPRDEYGKFRKVLARLKQDLGVAGLDQVAKKVAKVEGLNEIGSYAEAAKASGDLLEIVDRLDTGALNADSLENIRSTTSELGKVIANLPLPFEDPAQKLRYSDLPPALQGLIEDMITRVETKIGKKDADIATADLKSFKSGGDVYGQSDISSQVNKLLRLLT